MAYFRKYSHVNLIYNGLFIMSTYIIGDVHGCYRELQRLLEKIKFQPQRDRLIFVGDLINRGSDSLQVLRLIRSLGASAQVVLGNHDISLLAYAVGAYHGRGSDFPDMMKAKDSWELVEWLRQQPLLIYDKRLNTVVVHAGIPPRWTVKEAIKQAKKAEKKLRSHKFKKYLKKAYEGEREQWDKDFDKYDRFRYRLNGFTRLRYCYHHGEPDFKEKCPVGEQSKKLTPWFAARKAMSLDKDIRILFGHWAALGLHETDNAVCIDSGCVWGGQLTAVKLGKKGLKYTHVRAGEKKS